ACTGYGGMEAGCGVTCFDLGTHTSRRQLRFSAPHSLASWSGDRIAYGCALGEIYLATSDDLDGTCLPWPDEWKEEVVKVIRSLAFLPPGDRLIAITSEYDAGKGGSRLFTRATSPNAPVHMLADHLDLLSSLDVSDDGLFAAIGHYKPGVVEV